MANNLHITYSLNAPAQNQEAVIQQIKNLGNWGRINEVCWYVKSRHTARQAADAIRAVMKPKDSIYVVDSANNQAAWHNIPDEVSALIRDQWNKYAEASASSGFMAQQQKYIDELAHY